MAKILIVDGDASAAIALARAIEGEGFDVALAHDGRQGYEAALQEPPAMVFLNPALAVFDGYETCRRLRGDPAFPPNTPIIFLTRETAKDWRAMERAGATDTLPPTYSQALLRDLLVRYLLAY